MHAFSNSVLSFTSLNGAGDNQPVRTRRTGFLSKEPGISRDDKGFNHLSLWTLGSPAEIDNLLIRDLDTKRVVYQNDFNQNSTEGLRFHYCKSISDLSWKEYPPDKPHIVNGRLRLEDRRNMARMTMLRQLPTNFSMIFTVKKLGSTGMFRFKIYANRDMTIPVFFTGISGFESGSPQVLSPTQPMSKLDNEDAHPGRKVFIGDDIISIGKQDTKYRLVKQGSSLQLYINDQLRSDVKDLVSVSEIPGK